MTPAPSAPATDVVAVILVGGLARRMGGGDKCLRRLGDRPLLDHILDRLRTQVDRIVINANGDPARFAAYQLPVVADSIEGFAGPLAGVLAGLDWIRHHAPGVHGIVTVPGDSPFLPRDLVRRLLETRDSANADLVRAVCGDAAQPVVGWWPLVLAVDLRSALVDEQIRKIDVWTARHRLAEADFATGPVNPFYNANRPEDLAEAERFLALAE